jgi:acid phosphatase
MSVALAACLVGWTRRSGAAGAAVPALPTPAHVVVVVMENRSFDEILGKRQAPYIAQLAAGGASFTRSFAIAHPSEPNYFALFSGSTQDIKDDGNYSVDAPTLAGALAAAGRSFAGYAEKGSPRKHNPWESFADSSGVERDLSSWPSDFGALPTVSFVIPNLDDDMHDGSVAQGDAWLRRHLGAYADWCRTHDSLLIVTFDEDDDSGSDNRIPTVIYGARVEPGRYSERIDDYTLLRTIEAMYGLPPLGLSADRQPITAIWSRRAMARRTPP